MYICIILCSCSILFCVIHCSNPSIKSNNPFLNICLVTVSSKDGFDLLQNDFFSVLKTFAAGVMIGVAIMHLLVDSILDLTDVYEYPGE